MKKVISILALMILSVMMGYAQDENTTNNGVNFAVRLGYNISNRYSYRSIKEYFTYLPAANIGVTADIGQNSNLVFRPGLYFSMKGYKETSSAVTPIVEYAHFNYLDIPLLAVYKININENLKFEMQLGPYLAFGVGGKEKVQKIYIQNSREILDGYEKVSSFENEDRFDYGYNIGFGFDIKQFYIGAAYESWFPFSKTKILTVVL